MKKNRVIRFPGIPWYQKIEKMMKLLVLLLTCSCLTLSANTMAQQQRVTLNLKNCSVKDLFYEIQRQTDLFFVYNLRNFENVGTINVKAKNEEVDKVLARVFEGRDVEFLFEDNTVVVRPMPLQQQQVQERKVTGVVKDEQGNVLPGVTIVLKGTSIGGATDVDGNFALEIPNMENLVLVFSFVGMETCEVTIKDNKPLTVVMHEDVQAMDEVVVTGYFNKAKSSYTGSAVSVRGEELKKISPTNLFKALQAYEPSFRIVENKEVGADPNAVPDILIRGKSSFEGNSNNPLFIMDGYEVSLETVFDTDMERISRVTILKDAAATAIYGSRAANGVVVIETKMPAQGKLSVSYSFNGTVEYPDLTDYDLLNAEEKLEFERLAGVYKGEDLGKQMELDQLYQERRREVLRGVNTYWLSKPLQTAFKHSHSLSLGGGNERSRYGVNINYGANPGVMKGSKRDRLGLSFTWTYNISNKIRIGNMLSVNQTKSEDSPYGDFSTYAKINPYERATDEKGRYIYKFSNGEINPLFNAALNSFDKSESTSYVDNFDVEWYVFDGLRITGRFSYTFGNSDSESFVSPKDSRFEGKPDEEKGLYSVSSSKNSGVDANFVINFYKQLEKHMFTIVGGMNVQSNSSDSRSFSGQGFLSDNLSNLDFAAQYEKDTRPSGKIERDRLIGFFVNASYAYDNRYMFDVSYRTDGSSKFGKENRFAPFWAAGFAWNIHNEHFLGRPEWLTNAKVRASLGYTGNVSFDPYQAQTTYIYNKDNIYMHGIGATIEVMGNDALKWQRKFSVNVGADLDFWEGRISLTAEYFKERTKDLLLDLSIPPSLGFAEYKENLGEMENQGWELSLRSQLIRNGEKDIYWALSFGTSDSKNKITKISNALGTKNEETNLEETRKPVTIYEEGESVDALQAVPSLGIDPETGKEVFIKKDGSYTTIWDHNDKIVCGTTDPKFQGSLNSFLTVKGISLNVSMNFECGGQTYNSTLAERVEGANPNYNADRRVLTDRWKEPGDKTFFKNIAINETPQLTTRFVQDYNVLNIGSISLGYDLKTDYCKKIGLNSLRFTFNMGDVYRFSTVKEERGLSYPYARTLTFSLSATL